MGKYFGTDGVRGIANDELTPHLAHKIGRAGAFVLEEHSNNKNTRTRVIIGTDTRISKDLLSASIAAGVMSVGADVIDVGVVVVSVGLGHGGFSGLACGQGAAPDAAPVCAGNCAVSASFL